MVQRGAWGSNVGFILAAVGGAVGLGNLWGFAYSASQGGGAAFVVLYFVFVLVVGVPVLTAELVIGRHTKRSPIAALGQVGGARLKWVGLMFVLVGFGILSFYSVIMGWTGRLLVDFIRGSVPEDTTAHFAAISEGTGAIVAHLVGMLLTILVISRGVQRGIERVSVVLMPTLFLLIAALAVWASTLSGGGPGYAFYLHPDLSRIFHTETITGAAGQAFFSLSLGMGAMITYASYLPGHGNLPAKAAIIALSDTLVAFVGGLVTFPVIFHFGLQQQVSDSAIGALFIAVPRGLLSLGGAGQVVGIVFFSALYIAALTSAISLLEVVSSAAIDSLGWTRARAGWLGGGAIALAGIPGALSSDWVGFLFQLVGQAFLVFGGLLLAVIVGYLWKDAARAELLSGFRSPALATAWIWLLRTVVPLMLAVTLYFAVLALGPAAKALFS
ncbi:MAG: sodium-dependent transporter [Acidobacteria bacterium]|nr:sodium-dependent transporter [Acidobacteriota bacterium]